MNVIGMQTYASPSITGNLAANSPYHVKIITASFNRSSPSTIPEQALPIGFTVGANLRVRPFIVRYPILCRSMPHRPIPRRPCCIGPFRVA